MAYLNTHGTLAKLLATENLIVEHNSSCQTASFNTSTRVLKLPVLKTEDKHVYNMFIGHEVGHALQTPQDWEDSMPEDLPHDYVNVIEDVRIEKFIQNKFPGLKVDFTRGYDELHKKDFFKLIDVDTNKLNFIDRINLHYKLGARALIKFNEEETKLLSLVDKCETFADVIEVAQLVYDHVKVPQQPEQPEHQPQPTEQPTGGSSSDSEEANNFEQGDADGGESDTPEQSRTQRAMDESMDELKDVTPENKYEYVKAPKVKTNEVVLSLNELRDSFDNVFEHGESHEWLLDDDYHKFLNSIRADVNYMVGQFEMRKSADSYSRTQVQKTGMLDTSQVHNYKLTDDIFLKQHVVPEGKNHGMILYIDWSGSMEHLLLPLVKQLIVFAQFCTKAKIAFDVYTFTTAATGINSTSDEIMLQDNNLTHVLSSRVSNRQLLADQRNLYSQALWMYNIYLRVPHTPHLRMGGTPLNNILFTLPQIVSEFKRDTGAQKVSFVCMTDGASSPLHTNSLRHSTIMTKFMLCEGTKVTQLVRTRDIVRYLMDKLPDVSFTHIFLGGIGACNSHYRYYRDDQMNHSDFRKNQGLSFTTKDGWPLVTMIDPKSFGDSQQDSIEVKDNPTKGMLKNAFKKYLKNKATSKKLLSALVSQFS